MKWTLRNGIKVHESTTHVMCAGEINHNRRYNQKILNLKAKFIIELGTMLRLN